MKIIAEDNYNREHIPDTLVAENVHKSYIEEIVDFLNTKVELTDRWCRAVPDDYRLNRGMEDLV